jgi:hypothetical protein
MGDADRLEAELVGASVADPTAARLFALLGARVALIERRPDPYGTVRRSDPLSGRLQRETPLSNGRFLNCTFAVAHGALSASSAWSSAAATSASTIRRNADEACAAATALASGAGRQIGGRSLPCSRYASPWRL